MDSGGNQSSATKQPADSKPAKLVKLGRYVLKKKLGEGGMGAVYRAEDVELGRIVALKVLPRDKAQNELLVKRFKAEAKAAATLKHPNIVGVYDSGEVEGYLYIAMEHIDGIDLHELVKRKGVVSPKRSLDIMRQATKALQHAYEKGIVHRDIKPSNFLINREGQVKLADMGLARSLTDTAQSGITRAGTTVGTVDYMSPEQTRDSKSADSRSDIYSLGATWYHMLVGEPIFPDGDLLNKIHAHGAKAPPDPRAINSDVPESFVAIMHRMLAKKPDDRYQTPEELLQELQKTSSSKRELTSDMLAALASSDEEDDAVTRKDMAIPSPSSSGSQSRLAALLDEETDSEEISFGAAPTETQQSSPTATRPTGQRRPDSGRTSERKNSRERIAAPTAPPRDSATVPPRRRSEPKGVSVSFDYGRIVAIVIAIAVVAGVVGLISNHLRNRAETPGAAQPESPDVVPEGRSDHSDESNSGPQKLN